MAAAVASGRRIPEDFSVVSIDMPAQAAQMTTPTMTTVGPVAADMGKAAAEMLIRRIEGQRLSAPSQALFDGQLVVRASSGPAPAPR
jgi:DNA-binding LacI/PurR family transcriptional regulator